MFSVVAWLPLSHYGTIQHFSLLLGLFRPPSVAVEFRSEENSAILKLQNLRYYLGKRMNFMDNFCPKLQLAIEENSLMA